jgi:hypothetical protein
VKVLDGPRRGETGMVVAADGENVTVLADNNKEQFSVKADQLAVHAAGMDTGVCVWGGGGGGMEMGKKGREGQGI